MRNTGISEEIKAGRESLAMLHAVVSRQLTSNPTLLAGWNGARRVTSKPGVARGGSGSIPSPHVAPVVPVASVAPVVPPIAAAA